MTKQAPKPTSVRELFREHAEYVHSLARRQGVRSSDDARDIAQEVFLTVHRQLHTFEGRSSIKTWISGICVRKVNEYHRQRARDRKRRGAMVHEPQRATGRSQEAHIHESTVRAWLEAEIAVLPEKVRAVFVLYATGDLEMDEVAKAVGCPVDTASSRMRHARLRLAPRYERTFGRKLSAVALLALDRSPLQRFDALSAATEDPMVKALHSLRAQRPAPGIIEELERALTAKLGEGAWTETTHLSPTGTGTAPQASGASRTLSLGWMTALKSLGVAATAVGASVLVWKPWVEVSRPAPASAGEALTAHSAISSAAPSAMASVIAVVPKIEDASAEMRAGFSAEYEVESARRSGSFVLRKDPQALRGKSVEAVEASSYEDAEGDAKLVFTLHVPATGDYFISLHTNVPDMDNDCVWYAIDAAQPNRLDLSTLNVKYGSFGWEYILRTPESGVRVTFELSQGQHTLTLANCAAGVRIDQVAIRASQARRQYK